MPGAIACMVCKAGGCAMTDDERAELITVLMAIERVRDELLDAEDAAPVDESVCECCELVYDARQSLEQALDRFRAALGMPERSTPRLVWPVEPIDDIPF